MNLTKFTIKINMACLNIEEEIVIAPRSTILKRHAEYRVFLYRSDKKEPVNGPVGSLAACHLSLLNAGYPGRIFHIQRYLQYTVIAFSIIKQIVQFPI